MFYLTSLTLSSPLAAAGTVQLSYPAGTSGGLFLGAPGHLAVIDGGTRTMPKDFGLAFNAGDITFTWRGERTLPAGTQLDVQLDVPGNVDTRADGVAHATFAPATLLLLGSPIAADADGICAAQAVGGPGAAAIDGALASGGVAVLDVPRGVTVASSAAGDTTQTVTLTGLDTYDAAMVETLALSGTTAVNGKKAFKQVLSVVVSAGMTGNLTVGTTNVLGLPVYLPSAGYVLAELEDGVAATAGTFVHADMAANSATSGDVRGTYVANSAPNGARGFSILAALPDPQHRGPAQYAG